MWQLTIATKKPPELVPWPLRTASIYHIYFRGFLRIKLKFCELGSVTTIGSFRLEIDHPYRRFHSSKSLFWDLWMADIDKTSFDVCFEACLKLCELGGATWQVFCSQWKLTIPTENGRVSRTCHVTSGWLILTKPNVFYDGDTNFVKVFERCHMIGYLFKVKIDHP